MEHRAVELAMPLADFHKLPGIPYLLRSRVELLRNVREEALLSGKTPGAGLASYSAGKNV
jgi:hypothetical protein